MFIFPGIIDVAGRIGAVDRPVQPLKLAFSEAADAKP